MLHLQPQAQLLPLGSPTLASPALARMPKQRKSSVLRSMARVNSSQIVREKGIEKGTVVSNT